MAQTLLVLIPCPGIGHLFSAIELANLLASRNDRLSITMLLMKHPNDGSTSSALDASSAHARVNFVHLPDVGTFRDTSANNFFIRLVQSYRSHITQAVAKLASEGNSSSLQQRLGGFILDMFCASAIDVANSFGVPSYIFYTSSSAMLGMMLYLQRLRDDCGKDVAEYRNTGEDIAFPGFARAFPGKLLPALVLRPETVGLFLNNCSLFRKARGIMVNTFLELEPLPLKFLTSEPNLPKVYPIGPIVNVQGLPGDSARRHDSDAAVKWLDHQPKASVVFLCFGSMARVDKIQAREIAIALENCKYRFLWSLRQSQPKDKVGMSSNYGADFREVLPDGFLERMGKIGRVIGWAPQQKILNHPSTGGFLTHCGWNSILEGIMSGVPMAAWPFYAEQQLNAFQLVKEMKLAVEIRMDFRRDFKMETGDTVSSEEIARGIRTLMENYGEKKGKMKVMADMCGRALKEGKSSRLAIDEFINDVFANRP